MNRKTTLVFSISVAFFLVVMGGMYWFFFRQTDISVVENSARTVSQNLSHDKCLGDEATVKIEEERLGKPPTYTTFDPKYDEGVAHITVKEKKTGKEIIKFDIENIRPGTYPLAEMLKCGIYITREFGFDHKNSKTLDNFSVGLWTYDYGGNGKKILSLAGKNKEGKEFVDYSYEFRVSPTEHYVALIKGYGGVPEHALVIKDLKTLKDVFVLPVADITKRNPDVVGDISFYPGGWTADGKYLWIDMFIGAETYGFVRVNSEDWTYEVFKAPSVTMGGDAFNVNNGMLTYGENVAPWSGVEEIDQQIQKEALQKRQVSSFYVYNVFTKKKYLVATTTDPTYYFRPLWVSDIELQYELPNGEKKIYKVNE